MTTIVASTEHGCVAADTRITGEAAIGNISKLREIRGAIYGLAGEVDPAFLFLDWLERLNPKESHRKRIEALHKMIPEETRNAFTVIELSHQGLAYYSGWGARVPILDKVWGTGTGSAIAISHVRHGMDPYDAILKAQELDECSGGNPEVMYLLPEELRS